MKRSAWPAPCARKHQPPNSVHRQQECKDYVTLVAQPTGNCLRDITISDASLELSPTDNTLTLSGRIPGVTEKSRLYFSAYDFLFGSDAISCHP